MTDTNETGGDCTEVKKDHGVLYIGMDLGTSRTSVSASNGVRETVYSIVGYPKDVVSLKLLKKDRSTCLRLKIKPLKLGGLWQMVLTTMTTEIDKQ